MKHIIYTCLVLLLLAAILPQAKADPMRTDINPALLYYLSFIVGTDLPQADLDYMLTNHWQGKLPARVVKLLGASAPKFRFIRQAAQSTVPCDWGIDWGAGPNTLLPQLGRARALVLITRLHAMSELQNGNETDARDDLLAAFALARNCSRDGSLIAVLVQIAGENIVCSTVAENYSRFSADTLQQLADGFDRAPARGTVANSMASTESHIFADWVEARIPELRNQFPGQDARVLDSFRSVFENDGDGNTINTNSWQRIVAASGGTSDGFLLLVRELKPLEQRMAAIAALPLSEYDEQQKQFDADMQKSANPLVHEIFPAMRTARAREFATLAELAMIRAAVAYKLHGDPGLNSVMDPCGQGPFQFQRFVFKGVDRGFELKSAYTGRGYPEVMIFVEKDGPAFYVNGKKAGEPVDP